MCSFMIYIDILTKQQYYTTRTYGFQEIYCLKRQKAYSRTCGNPVVIYYKFQMKKMETLAMMLGAYEEDDETEDLSA